MGVPGKFYIHLPLFIIIHHESVSNFRQTALFVWNLRAKTKIIIIIIIIIINSNN